MSADGKGHSGRAVSLQSGCLSLVAIMITALIATACAGGPGSNEQSDSAVPVTAPIGARVV